MKRIWLPMSLVALAMTFTSCMVDPYYQGPPRQEYHQGATYRDRVYKTGYNDAIVDRQRNNRYNADMGAHRYPSSNDRSVYRNGYAAGWRNNPSRPPGGGYQDAHQRAWRDGAANGANDRGRGRSFNPNRNIGNIPDHMRDSYVSGYREGYYRRH